MKSLCKSWGMGFSSEWRASFIHEKTSYQWALLEDTKKGLFLSSFGIDGSGKNLLSHLSGKGKDRCFISSALPGLAVLARQITLPKLSEEELYPAIIDLLEKNLNTSMNSYELTFESFPSKEDELSVMAYLIPQDILKEQLSFLQETLDPEWLFAKASCLAAFLHYFKAFDWNLIIDVGEDETTCALTWQGRVIQSSSLVGNASFFINIDDPNFTPNSDLSTYLQHLKETTLSYKERYGIPENTPVTITGRVALMPIAAPVISAFIQAPLSPLHEVSSPNEEGLPFLSCALAIGCAFLGHPSTKKELVANFRSHSFCFQNPLFHITKPLIALGLGSLAIATALFWWGILQQQKVRDVIQEEWQTVTASCSMTPEQVLEQFSKEKGAPPSSVVEEAQFLLDSVRKKSVFPLQPVVPNVSTVLAWLSKEMEAATAQDPTAKFEIQNIHYVMTKRPEKNLPKEHYLVRVDLDFTTPSQTLARALHDRLLTPNPFIEPKLEIKWVASGTKYTTSFYVKDKTYYPPQGQS